MYVSDVLLKTWTEILWRSLYRIIERDGVGKGNGCDRSVTFTFQFEFLPFSNAPGLIFSVHCEHPNLPRVPRGPAYHLSSH